uniref:Uncharacterized protein n=1 Tax=viral metagenome TaxID=1070528 RepID=A0A6C0BWB4_9ZZZZ
MIVRKSNGELVCIDETKLLNDTSLYNILWCIKFNKKVTSSTTISVEQMKKYLNSKCFSL